MIQTIGPVFFCLILLVSCTDFDQEACPNKCSYQAHQVTTINCQGQNDSMVVPVTSTHLILNGCNELRMLNNESLENIVSATIRNSRFEKNPANLLEKMKHIKCLRFEAVRFNGNSSLVEYFKPLNILEFIEFNYTHLSHTDMQNLLRGFTNESKLNSLVLTQQGIEGEDLILGEILSGLNETNLTCVTIQHEKDRNLIVPNFTNVAPYLEIFNALKCLRIKRNEWGFQNVLYHEHLKSVSITYYDNALIWPDTYLAQRHQRSKRDVNYVNEDFKKNTENYIKENNFSFIERCKGDRVLLPGSWLPPLKTLIFKHSDVRIINSYSMSCIFTKDLNVTHIDVSYSRVIRDVYGLNFILHGLNQLKYFNAEGNLIVTIPDIFFHFLPSLETLLLGKNNLGNTINSDKNGTLFSKLSSLIFLDLSDNNIRNIPHRTFSGLHQLRTLNLSGNILSTFEIDFTLLKSLEMLDLCLNIISTMSSVTTYSLDKIMSINTDLKINITEYQLRCSCGDLKSIKWFQEKGGLVFHNHSAINCSNTYGKIEALAIVDLRSLNALCNPITTGEIAAIVVPFLFVILIAALVYMIYRKRHQWRYWVFRMYYYRNDKLDSIEYLYDAYVCYSSEDSRFVHNILRPILEDSYKLKLCLDKRDFAAGNYITNNILESIEKSRRTLLILSPSFLKSDWCKYEMHMAYSKLLHYGIDVIVPLLYKSFDLKNTDSTLKSLMTKKTYIEWNDGNGRFWDHLSLILNNGECLSTAI